MNMEISETGYWMNKSPNHWFDQRLNHFISRLVHKKNIKTIVDFGCGDASYIKNLIDKNIYCEAYDGNPHTEEITNGIGKALDLSKPINLNKKFDCVLSLEVGEHIPEKYEQTFIENLTTHSNNLIILSWAIPNQGGDGHFNEKDNRYIINELKKRNFNINKEETAFLRKQSSINWFKKTIMIFEKTI